MLAAAALLVSIGTVVAFAVSLQVLLVPLRPVWYLGALGVAVILAAVAVQRSRRALSLSALVVTVFLFTFAAVFNFVLMRVPSMPSAFVVGQTAPDFTLADATGHPVRLADYRGHKPVVLVFYRGYW